VFKRILKSRAFVILAVAIIKVYVQILFWTCRVSVRIAPESKKIIDKKQLCFLSYWHSRILLFPKYMTTLGKFSAVISAHGDGEFLSHAIASYGHKTIRGSSRKQSTNAMRGIISTLRSGISVAITPDGPRGPRFKIKGNITTLAAKFKTPIIPICYSTSNATILNSWDRFIIPMPFSRVQIEIGDPIYFNESDDSLLEMRMMEQVTALDKELNLTVDY